MAKPYTVTRSTTIDAPAAVIHRLINDFHEWPSWSPWEGLDPQMSRTYTGADSGLGAHYAWEGNKKAGKGSMEITSQGAEQIDIALTFLKPFPADNRIVFTLAPTSDGGRERTQVTWAMHGEISGVMRVFTLVKSMDSLVGPDFDKGLAQLKQAAESQASAT